MADGSGPGTPPGPVSPQQPPSNDGADMDAAVEEANPQPKQITVRGLTFEIPAKQPFRAIYAARRVVSAHKSGDNNAAAAAMLDVATEYLGEDQMNQLLGLELDAEEGFKAASEVIDACNKAYGSAEGEASASSSS